MKVSHRFAMAFWLSFAAMIIIETLFSRPWMNSSEYVFSTALILSILALGWVFADSRENSVNVSKILSVCVVIAAFLTVPYYRFRYFGAKAGFTFLGIVLTYTAGLLVLAYVLEYVPFGR